MYKHLYFSLACSVAITGSCLSMIPQQPLQPVHPEQKIIEETLERTNNRLSVWLDYVSSLTHDKQNVILNYVFYSFIPQIAQFTPNTDALQKYLETASDDIKKAFDNLENDMTYILEPFIRYLEKSILQQETTPEETEENDINYRTALFKMRLNDMSVLIISMYYDALYATIYQNGGKKYLLCMFDETGLVEEKNRKLLPSFAEIIRQLQEAQITPEEEPIA